MVDKSLKDGTHKFIKWASFNIIPQTTTATPFHQSGTLDLRNPSPLMPSNDFFPTKLITRF